MMEDLPVSRNARQRGAGGGGGRMMHPSRALHLVFRAREGW